MSKKSKAEVHYSEGTPAEHCGNCDHYRKDRDLRAVGTCTRVAGAINARMWSYLWSPRKDAAKQVA